MKRSIGSPVRTAILGAFIAVSVSSGAQASSITIATETGVAMETEFGIRADTGTRGYELAGSTVTASFDDGTSETKTWEIITDFDSGGVNGDRWSLFQNNLGTVNIISDGRVMTGFSIDASTSLSMEPDFTLPGAPRVVRWGASLFDVSTADEATGPGSTPGSSFGFPFSFTFGEPDGDVAVTYSGAVNLLGAPAVGDLFTTMSVDFTGLTGNGFTGSANYVSDQDTLRFAGDLRLATPAPVPLPAGLPLLIAGLGGLGLLRRMKR